MTARVIKIRRPAAQDAPLSDEAIAHACASRDPAAVSELFDRFHAKVTRYLARAVGSGVDIEDLVQSTFLEVARGAARFDGRSSVGTWLLGIATNVARHHLRSRTRRARMLRAVKDSSPPQSTSRVAETVDARRLLQAVEQLIDEQPEERRLAFLLCELEGVSAGEAARMLETTETAIWKRVSDVRRALRALATEGVR